LNIAMVSHFGPGYSGGRIYAWFLLETLAMLGHGVTVYGDDKPDFLDEFSYFPTHDRIRFEKAPHFSHRMADDHDVLFCIPDLVGHWAMYFNVISYVKEHSCKFVLVSFETPNWKQLEHPAEHTVSEEYGSLEAARYADVILSISKLSREMAKRFFVQSPAEFDYLCPPIHCRIADSVPDPPKRDKRVLIISRFTPRYKNAHRFVEILSEACRGFEFVLLENGLMNAATLEAYGAACRRYGATFHTAKAVREREKFELIKSSVLTVYPSTFEGYGLPPVESLYCEVPCVAFELPVLRQVHGNDLIYARKGNFADFRNTLAGALTYPNRHTVDKTKLQCNPDVESFADGLSRIMQRLEGPHF